MLHIFLQSPPYIYEIEIKKSVVKKNFLCHLACKCRNAFAKNKLLLFFFNLTSLKIKKLIFFVLGLIVKNLVKKYKSKKALNKISFCFEKPQVIGLLGPNGAGKTTLMKILTGSMLGWEGTIKYNHFSLPKDNKKFQQKIGYLPENNPLYDEMYVKEYLLFSKKFYNKNGVSIEDIIEKTGLKKYSNQKIKELSKGYRQRVGIAASIFHDPDLLFLDEPTTGLDPNQTLEIRNLIKNLGENKIVLISSHILQEIEAMCNRVIILNRGNIILDESLAKIQKKNIKLEKLFNRLTKEIG